MPILRLDDADIHYETFGRGPALLFCAATATHGDVWKFFQTEHFAKTRTVIVYDQRGTGSSPARSNDFSTRRLAADAAALLDHVGAGPAAVCGHSNGGRVAQMLTLEHPEKVAKLVLMSSGGASDGKGIPLSLCLQLVEKGFDRYMREQCVENGFTKEWAAANPAELERYLAVRLAKPPSLEVFLRHVIAREDYNPAGRLKEIKVPTLVMVGDDEDHGRPGHMTHYQYAHALAAEIPGARLSVLPRQGHYYYFSNPADTNAIIGAFIG
jgi:pimeloyl-ACP methyl ester carboxylesterase